MKQIRVLMIDDNEKLIDAVKEAFKNNDRIKFVLDAHNGKDGFELIKNKEDEYDIIILDLIMPEKDGLYVLEAMKEANMNKKVIVATSYNATEVIRQVSEYGVNYYVLKPFDASKMLWEMSHQQSAANGGVMRTSIVGLFPKAVEECAATICRLTHYDPRCVGSCVIVSLLIHSLVYGEEKLSYHQIVDIGERYDSRIREYIDLSLNTDIRALELQDWDSVGYTLKTLAAGLWAYWNAKSFEDGLLSVVRAGGDADTNAAVACAILGAKYGFSSIPDEYVNGLIYKEQLEEVVNGMIGLVK